MGLTIQEAIDTVYLDTAHYDVDLKFSSGFEILDHLAVHGAHDLVPFTYVDGDLKTPEFKIDCYITAMQDRQLQQLYSITVHPGYIDQRYPVTVSWGSSDSRYRHIYTCYLAAYTPPDTVNYESAEILSATMTLRVI